MPNQTSGMDVARNPKRDRNIQASNGKPIGITNSKKTTT
jgi:hypothetical protein